MVKKIIILTLIFYFLALLQASFFVHFKVWGIIPNLILISVILINILAPHQNWWGVAGAFIGGLFLDIFSPGVIGFYVLICLALSLFIKLVFKKYVWASLG